MLARFPSPSERTIWWLFIVALPVLSIYGRQMQHWALDYIGQEGIGWITLLFLALAVLGLALSLESRPRSVVVASAGILLIGSVFVLVPVAEERVHVVLFGAIGFFSLRFYGLWLGSAFCIGLAVGDEVLQAFLPDRVCDIRDVIMNAASSAAGIGISWFTRRTTSD